MTTPNDSGQHGDEMFYRVSYTQALQEVRAELRENTQEVKGLRADLKQALEDNEDLKKRVRALELRFYGILAGLLTAIGVIVYSNQGGPTP